MRLAGIAADQDGAEIVRTAILSTFSGVILARPGDEVLGRFRVTAVEDEAVELVTLSDGTPIRLTLKSNSHRSLAAAPAATTGPLPLACWPASDRATP